MLAKNLRYLRKKKQIGQDELAKHLGYKSFTTVQKWEDGSSTPPYKVINQLANFFNTNVEQFVNIDLSINHYIPVIGQVRAGLPIYATENFEELLYDELIDNNDQEYFYLRVVGDSMINARIMAGDIICVKKQDNISNNDIGVVLVDDEATVKRILFKGDKVILQPENDSYQPLVFSKKILNKEQVFILGKVVYNRISL